MSDGSGNVCPLMHEPLAENGWEACPVMFNGKPHSMHVVPCGDLKRHQLDRTCWCKPCQDEELGFWVHNSADGREKYEEGAKPS
jgi:hypothetical protein